jgi:hypothetical protein
MLLKLIKIKTSHKKDKKLDAVFEKDGREKVVPFGASGYTDFIQSKDEGRKERYLNRHKSKEDWNNPLSAGALSRWILWNKPTLKESIKDYKNKFNL